MLECFEETLNAIVVDHLPIQHEAKIYNIVSIGCFQIY